MLFDLLVFYILHILKTDFYRLRSAHVNSKKYPVIERHYTQCFCHTGSRMIILAQDRH